MFIFKREPAAEEFKTEKLKKIVGKTVEEMLRTREETVYFLEEYNLVLIFSWEGEYIEGSIYQWTDFQMSLGEGLTLYNAPLYVEKRYIQRKDDSLVIYIDDEKIKSFSPENLKVFYCICELIRIFEVEINNRYKYKCVWP